MPGFKILRFRKKIFFKFGFIGLIEKCISCFLVDLFLGVIFIKKCKKMCLCDGIKNCIVTCEKCMFWCEKGYEQIRPLGSCKTHY